MKTQTEIMQNELNVAVWMFNYAPAGKVKEFWRGKMSAINGIADALEIELSFSEAVNWRS